MKLRIYWRALSPMIVLPLGLILFPVLFIYGIVKNPRQFWRAWRQARKTY